MWFGSYRHHPVFELNRDDGRGTPSFEAARRRYGIADVNRLSSSEALSLTRSIRDKALKMALPDSTDGIRSDRDRR